MFGKLTAGQGRRMYSATRRGVPLKERIEVSLAAPPDWDSVRIFLEVVRCGSFRSASERLGQSINVLRRAVDDLQEKLGVILLTRHVDGTRLTDEGAQVFAAAERMEAASFDLMRATESPAGAMASGEVRIAATEGMGTFWIAPKIVEFQRLYPRISVDLRCAMKPADILRLEADVAVQLARPTALDLKVVKLGCMHVMLYASEEYLRTYGAPKTRQELLKHRLIMQFADQTAAKEIYDSWFPDIPQDKFLMIRNNVSSANLWMITKGAGIGLLPTYATAIGARVVPLDIDLRRPFDIWLTYHPDAKRIPRVRHLIEWIVEAFNPAVYPWFRDEFIHPKKLGDAYRGEPIINYF
jgi:DNA-binding transcriptional LysR family regulator